jgi:YihY family inner membrane protein
MKVPAVLERFLDRPAVGVVRDVMEIYAHAPGGLLANGLAFATLFAVVPIALVTLGVAGLLVNDPAVQQQLAAALSSLLPPLQELIQAALESMAQGAAVTSLVGVAGLIWTVSQFYVTLDIAFSRIFSDRPERDLFRRTARGFIWVVGLIGVVVALVVATSLAAAAEALLPTTSPALTGFGRVMSSPPMVTLITILVVLLVYQVVPPRRPAVSAAAPPAIVAGLVIFALGQIFLFAAPRIVGTGALAGPLATAFIALAWLSFSFQALLYGAAWTRVRDDALSGGRASRSDDETGKSADAGDSPPPSGDQP